MIYSNKQLGEELQKELDKGYDIVRISRWAFRIFHNNIRDLNPSQRNVITALFAMEDDPQFEYPFDVLMLLAKMLINDEKDPIKKINEMVLKRQI